MSSLKGNFDFFIGCNECIYRNKKKKCINLKSPNFKKKVTSKDTCDEVDPKYKK